MQSPGPAFGSWEFLDTLLQPGTPFFVFREPLGQAREVKVALSGLFGRFVARAYLLRYFGLSIFYHPNLSNPELDGNRQIKICRVKEGDLPDWVACDSSFNLFVAEAKGSHESGRATRVLNRARKQTERIDVLVGGTPAPVKRLAIVARWGMAMEGPIEPWLRVQDPIDEGDPLGPDDRGAIFVGLFRHHVANIMSGLGQAELAELLRDLTKEGVLRNGQEEGVKQEQANGLVDTAVEDFHRLADDIGIPRADLIGRFVTRGSLLIDAPSLSGAHLEMLSRLGLRPVLVGFESKLVRLAVEGDPSSIRDALADHQRVTVADRARSDGAGFWIIPLED